MERQRKVGVVALVVAALLAVGTVVGLVRGLQDGDWVIASGAAVLMAAALSQWAAVRARARGGRLLTGEAVLLVALGVLGLVLCGLDFVTGERANRAFTVLFAAGVIVVVGGVVGSYWRSPDRAPTPGNASPGTPQA